MPHLVSLQSPDIEINPGTMERLPLESQYFMRYSMIRANHPCNTKIGVVCIYYKEYLPLTREIAIGKLNESIVTKITVNNKRCFLTCLYRSPNQNQEQFESFSENLIDVLSGINNQQPTYSIIVGDFNAILSKWCPSDKYNKAGQDTDTFPTTSGYTQMTGQPKYVINETP